MAFKKVYLKSNSESPSVPHELALMATAPAIKNLYSNRCKFIPRKFYDLIISHHNNIRQSIASACNFVCFLLILFFLQSGRTPVLLLCFSWLSVTGFVNQLQQQVKYCCTILPVVVRLVMNEVRTFIRAIIEIIIKLFLLMVWPWNFSTFLAGVYHAIPDSAFSYQSD